MDATIAQPAFDRRRGDGSFVSLLFVVAVPVAAVVVALTRAFVAPTDSTLVLVPREAVAYVHASGPHAVAAMLASSPDMPADVRPDEVARFAVPGDDGLRHAIILAWRVPRLPTDAEVAALRERDAVMVDERRAVLGDDALGLRVKVSSVIDASVMNDPALAKALARMRALHGVQGFVDPAAIPDDARALVEDANAGKPLSPIVFGATVREDRVLVRARPLAGGSPVVDSPTDGPDVRDVGAPLAVAETSPTFDVVRTLFAEPTDAHPAPEVLHDAADALRGALDAPRITWFAPSASGGVDSLIHVPAVAPETAKAAIAAYTAALAPSRSVVTLPDGDVAVEFAITPSALKAGVEVFGDPEVAGVAYVGDDGSDGTLIASSASMYAAFHGRSVRRIPPFCRSSSMLLMEDGQAVDVAGYAAIFEHMRNFGITSLIVGFFGDNEVHACGYRNDIVDK